MNKDMRRRRRHRPRHRRPGRHIPAASHARREILIPLGACSPMPTGIARASCSPNANRAPGIIRNGAAAVHRHPAGFAVDLRGPTAKQTPPSHPWPRYVPWPQQQPHWQPELLRATPTGPGPGLAGPKCHAAPSKYAIPSSFKSRFARSQRSPRNLCYNTFPWAVSQHTSVSCLGCTIIVTICRCFYHMIASGVSVFATSPNFSFEYFFVTCGVGGWVT